MKIGFNFNESKTNTDENTINNTILPNIVTEEPVRSVATVCFKNGKEYPYYNNEFKLNIGDVVFVDGKLAGQPGRVTHVTTKFKVSLDFYKRVIAKLNLEFHGKFEKVNNFMLSKDSTLSFEQVNTWFNPPREEEEFFIGDGYEVALCKIVECPDIQKNNYENGVEYYFDDAVKFISVKNGVGKAIVGKHKYHIVDFIFENGIIKNLYCDCISPEFCKHIIAVCIVLKMLYEENAITESNDFTAVSQNLFYNVVSYNTDKITV